MLWRMRLDVGVGDLCMGAHAHAAACDGMQMDARRYLWVCGHAGVVPACVDVCVDAGLHAMKVQHDDGSCKLVHVQIVHMTIYDDGQQLVACS